MCSPWTLRAWPSIPYMSATPGSFQAELKSSSRAATRAFLPLYRKCVLDARQLRSIRFRAALTSVDASERDAELAVQTLVMANIRFAIRKIRYRPSSATPQDR